MQQDLYRVLVKLTFPEIIDIMPLFSDYDQRTAIKEKMAKRLCAVKRIYYKKSKTGSFQRKIVHFLAASKVGVFHLYIYNLGCGP